ncbi:helix-turn-helix domain-containing protein [uncultured Tateyamaria sp.]|uniref:winged helix-turn-helix transcriptional regulator n=2 Tax=uncultured Tateyamaria sp. TaxID=455651 RepID=UPI00262A8858|nr:helix-turn-helix domain-containing protein [uncultured Tateyamaria sp.]
MMTNDNIDNGSSIRLDEKYPARRVLNHIGDKWTPIILHCLASGTRHFGQMHRRIPGLSKKMLTQVLRRLERDGLVTRRVLRAVPPKTDYELTSLGLQLHEPIGLICQWAIQNEDVLDAIDKTRAKQAED